MVDYQEVGKHSGQVRIVGNQCYADLEVENIRVL